MQTVIIRGSLEAKTIHIVLVITLYLATTSGPILNSIELRNGIVHRPHGMFTHPRFKTLGHDWHDRHDRHSLKKCRLNYILPIFIHFKIKRMKYHIFTLLLLFSIWLHNVDGFELEENEEDQREQFTTANGTRNAKSE